MPNRHFLFKFWECQKAVSILPHEAKALLHYFAFNQSFLAKGKIAPVVLLPHEAKEKWKFLHWQIKTGLDSISSDQDWTRTEKFHTPLIFAVSYSQCCKIYFLYFINWLNARALSQLADAKWNWSYDKDYIFGFADLLCHITENHNPNCKLVSGFQNLLKKCCSLHQKFSHEKSRLYQPRRNNNAVNPNDDHSHSRNSLWTRFIVLAASATNLVL